MSKSGKTPENPEGNKAPFCAELEDLGGGEPLDFDDVPAVLEAAAAALLTFGAAQRAGSERYARLYLLSGFVRGHAARLRFGR